MNTLATIATIDPTQVQSFHLALMALLGLAFSMPLQAFVEHALAEKPWMNGALKPFKALLPSLITGVLGFIATKLGVSPADALAVAAALTGGAHVVNATSLAADARWETDPAGNAIKRS